MANGIIFRKIGGRIVPIAAALGASAVAAYGTQKIRQKAFEKIRGKGKTGTGNPFLTATLDFATATAATSLFAARSKTVAKGFRLLDMAIRGKF